MASDAGISYQLLKMIETGKEKGRRRITEETARKISMATGVSSLWLMGKGLKTKPTTDRSCIEKFSQEPFTRDYYQAMRAAADAGSSFLKTTKDVDDFCRIEAKNHGQLMAIEMELALRGAVKMGQEAKVFAVADKCLQSLRKLAVSCLTDEERDFNARFAAAMAKRQNKLIRA